VTGSLFIARKPPKFLSELAKALLKTEDMLIDGKGSGDGGDWRLWMSRRISMLRNRIRYGEAVMEVVIDGEDEQTQAMRGGCGRPRRTEHEDLLGELPCWSLLRVSFHHCPLCRCGSLLLFQTARGQDDEMTLARGSRILNDMYNAQLVERGCCGAVGVWEARDAD
jgi:hypothetical protein